MQKTVIRILNQDLGLRAYSCHSVHFLNERSKASASRLKRKKILFTDDSFHLRKRFQPAKRQSILKIAQRGSRTSKKYANAKFLRRSYVQWDVLYHGVTELHFCEPKAKINIQFYADNILESPDLNPLDYNLWSKLEHTTFEVQSEEKRGYFEISDTWLTFHIKHYHVF